MRWLQDRPVLGIGTWRYWVGPSIRLGEPELIDVLLQGGYPADHVCVLCGKTIVPSVDGLDWWSLKGVSGPSCRFSECRNKESCNRENPVANNCPFRSDRPFQGLHPERASEIATALLHDGDFPCHKTVDYAGDDERACHARF
jgi:hypothetical protein